MTQLEQEVLCIINEAVDGCYTGKLKIHIIEPERQCGDPSCRALHNTIYELRLYLDRWYTPLILSYEGSEKEFKDFIRKEFKKNRYELIHYYKITREPIVFEETDWDDE